MPDASEAAPGEASRNRRAPKHPKTELMVEEALRTLNKRGGSSLQAIKAYISQRYTLDIQRFASRICKCLREEVQAGRIIQTKGAGANGSFKMARKVKKKDAAAADKIKEKKQDAKDEEEKAKVEPKTRVKEVAKEDEKQQQDKAAEFKKAKKPPSKKDASGQVAEPLKQIRTRTRAALKTPARRVPRVSIASLKSKSKLPRIVRKKK